MVTKHHAAVKIPVTNSYLRFGRDRGHLGNKDTITIILQHVYNVIIRNKIILHNNYTLASNYCELLHSQMEGTLASNYCELLHSQMEGTLASNYCELLHSQMEGTLEVKCTFNG